MKPLPLVAAFVLPAFAAFAQPADLAGEWRVTALAGAPVAAEVEITLAFLPEGRIAGRSACNRYMGAATLGDGTISVGPTAGTRMACPPPFMQAEQDYLALLAAARTWKVEGGVLTITAADDRSFTARR